MGKSLYIAEKPSVAQEFAKALKQNMKRREGWLESDESVVTWCVGHLVTMSYPEVYDPKYKKWSLSTLPLLTFYMSHLFDQTVNILSFPSGISTHIDGVHIFPIQKSAYDIKLFLYIRNDLIEKRLRQKRQRT